MFELEITDDAVNDLRYIRKFEQKLILGEIEKQLCAEPLTQTRNRKPLRPNDLSEWELRIDRFRVFYDANVEAGTVKIKAIGWKEHNRLLIRGREFVL